MARLSKGDECLAMPVLRCPDCGSFMVLVKNREGRQFYGCAKYPECRCTHGAHPDGRPMGTPAAKLVREARKAAHESFDALWQEAWRMYPAEPGRPNPSTLVFVARNRAYAWLSEQLGMSKEDCHIANFDEEQCAKVVEVCQNKTAEDIRKWWKAKKAAEKAAETNQGELKW